MERLKGLDNMAKVDLFNLEDFNLPKNIKGEKFYKILEWLQVCQEFKDYLDTEYNGIVYLEDFKKNDFRLFSNFVDYALSGICKGMLNAGSTLKHKVISNPIYTRDLIWGNLKDYLLDSSPEKAETSEIVMKFLNSFALKHELENPYSMEEVKKLVNYKETMSKNAAWELLKEGDEYQKRLLNGSTISDEIDIILSKSNVSFVFPKAEVDILNKKEKTFDDFYFLYDVNGDGSLFSLLPNTHQIRREFLALELGISSLRTTCDTDWNAPSNNPKSLTSRYPYLVDMVVNLEDEANIIKRYVNPNAKINKTKRLVGANSKITE